LRSTCVLEILLGDLGLREIDGWWRRSGESFPPKNLSKQRHETMPMD